MDKNYIYQIENRDWIENKLGKQLMIPVHGTRKDNTWDICIQSYLTSPDNVEELKTDTYDARFGMPGITVYGSWESDEKIYSAWNNNYGQEPFVIERDYNGLAPTNIEIVEEFRLLFNLYYNSQKNEYIDVENDGITVIRTADTGFICVHKRYLKTYLALKNKVMLIHVDSLLSLKFIKLKMESLDAETSGHCTLITTILDMFLPIWEIWGETYQANKNSIIGEDLINLSMEN